jgi:hypothetical protein
MLEIITAKTEFFKEDEDKGVFIVIPSLKIALEHSLLSISKWESEFEKPFLSKERKGAIEFIRYIEYMIVSPLKEDLPEGTSTVLLRDHLEQIQEYIGSSRTATTVRKKDGRANTEQITSELIYYWMITQQIPFECETWHLNRLLTLINVCMVKSIPGKKMSRREMLSSYANLNAARRATLNSSG